MTAEPAHKTEPGPAEVRKMTDIITYPLSAFLEDEEADLEYYRTVNSCPAIQVEDKDSLEIAGYSIYVHEAGLASRIKGKVTFTPFQWRALFRQMVEDEMEIEDWSSVDLSGWAEEQS